MTAVATTAAAQTPVGQQQSSSSMLSQSQSTRSNRSHSVNASDRPAGGLYDSENDEEGDYDGEDDDEEGTIRAPQQGHDLVAETTVKSGYLYKRGEKRKNWKKRWFVLRSAKLYYYKNEKEYQLLRFIDMSEVHTIAAVELKKADNCFGISTSKRQYYVRASTPKEMQQWVDALREVREQVRQRSTLTRDMAMVDIGSSGGENGPQTQKPHKPNKSGSTSPMLEPVDRVAQGTAASSGKGSAPISIVIPGKGLYTSPAQPRITTGGMVISPLSATSDSDVGGPSGAEQFGLSYTSSAGQSLASSPGRAGMLHHHHHQPLIHQEVGNASAAGEEAVDPRSSRVMRRASGMREASVGSSTGGEAPSLATTAALLQRRSSSQQPPAIQVQSQAQVMSSSDEDEGDGDDWDEDEEADRAMPLPSPGGLGLLSPHAASAHTNPVSAKAADGIKGQSSNDTILQTTPSKPKVAPEFFKDTSKVIHQGYLMKQSNRRKHWRKRWFVLTSSTLSYSRSHMDAKLARQIPLSSILDAIEYTSKKQSQLTGGAPLSPSLSAFASASSGLPFARSPLLGNSAEGTVSTAGASEKRTNSMQSKTSAPAAAPGSSDVEQGATAAMSSGTELETPVATTTTTTTERKVHVASNQPTAASARADEQRQQTIAAAAPSSQQSTPAKRKKENCFKIITPKRVYVVGAPTEEEELKWLSALQALLSHYHDQKENSAPKAQQQQQPAQHANPTPAATPSRPNRVGSQDDTQHTSPQALATATSDEA